MKISIIIPSFNQAEFVEAALLSVISQDYDEKEILFIDGGSTDGTMAIVEKYRPHLAYCISEPDEGQSDALRKGFGLATGEILTWLNTDDLLMPGVLSEVATAFEFDPKVKWVFGNVVWIDADDNILRCRKGERHFRVLTRVGVLTACGPSAFFSKALYEETGGINPKLHYMMDTELWWRFALAGEKYHRLKRYAWSLRLHDRAKMSAHHFVNANDHKAKINALNKRRERDHIHQIAKQLRIPVPSFLRQFLRGAICLLTPGYARALWQSQQWQGKNIYEFIKADIQPTH